MLNFCTLFDSNYSAKGLTMYYSLLEKCSDFHLYLFAFDDTVAGLLKQLNLKKATVISLKEFEDEKLLNIKATRTKGEYCWTCTPSTILYCIEKYHLAHCTYIDADLFFFSNPKVLVDEIGNNDVLITSHRYTPGYDKSEVAGKYCVQFVTFKNTSNGLTVLNWWREACIDWCYNRLEDGKFGDQKYLDDWTTRFEGVYELQHLGGGVAPWNMQQYSFRKENGVVASTELSSGKQFEVIFFHFHAMLSYKKGVLREFYFEEYALPESARKQLYMPYVKLLKKYFCTIKKQERAIDGIATKPLKYSLWKYVKIVRKRILHKENRYSYWLSFK